MRKLKFTVALIGVVGITAFSCRKDPIETNPAKAILGKWEIMEIGNWPDMSPYSASEYVEYLPDSIFRVYNYTTKEYLYSNERYWIDSVLHKSIKREDGLILIRTFKYKFYDNKLRLDYENMLAQFNTFIYKRIK